MIHGYPETYLNSAMAAMGDTFDYAINDCHIPATDFVKLFLAGNVCRKIENGEPNYLLGKSGIEIVWDILNETTGRAPDSLQTVSFSRSPEYWCGWILCYYQWLSGKKYADIFEKITFDDLLSMYPALHEADVTQFAERMDKLLSNDRQETHLKQFRSRCGYSQSRLADLSGVSLRSVQMFEQRNKDINKARAETLLQLSKALGCNMEDLMEL